MDGMTLDSAEAIEAAYPSETARVFAFWERRIIAAVRSGQPVEVPVSEVPVVPGFEVVLPSRRNGALCDVAWTLAGDTVRLEVTPRPCRDCAVSGGEPHAIGCDVARCLVTGWQRISCNRDHDCGRDTWTGLWPGEAECWEFGWFSVFSKGWQRCAEDTPGAGPDLNRLYSGEAWWDPVAKRWQRR